MKRLWIGSILLFILLSVGFAISYGAEQLCPPISTLLDDAAANALQDDLPRGSVQSAEAKRLWDKYKPLVATVADHTPMEDVDRMFRELEIYAASDEAPHFAACCAQLSSMIIDIGQAHKLNFWNFF